eukprot:TRINITY_DN67543_c1_g5_i1.p1 TRINITY_DN67543_c1_g5~~TRINITY_DN67543_c1_g5_i1.p1  ORF type:complete len:210 (+),score=19.20 TRINITY_DN67543_c1_g5_i1:74-703(+)
MGDKQPAVSQTGATPDMDELLELSASVDRFNSAPEWVIPLQAKTWPSLQAKHLHLRVVVRAPVQYRRNRKLVALVEKLMGDSHVGVDQEVKGELGQVDRYGRKEGLCLETVIANISTNKDEVKAVELIDCWVQADNGEEMQKVIDWYLKDVHNFSGNVANTSAWARTNCHDEAANPIADYLQAFPSEPPQQPYAYPKLLITHFVNALCE